MFRKYKVMLKIKDVQCHDYWFRISFTIFELMNGFGQIQLLIYTQFPYAFQNNLIINNHFFGSFFLSLLKFFAIRTISIIFCQRFVAFNAILFHSRWTLVSFEVRFAQLLYNSMVLGKNGSHSWIWIKFDCLNAFKW